MSREPEPFAKANRHSTQNDRCQVYEKCYPLIWAVDCILSGSSVTRNCLAEANWFGQKQERQSDLRKEAKLESEAQDLSKMLTGVSVTIAQKAAENDQLFGSVTSKDIAEALEKQKFSIDRRKVQLEESIKQRVSTRCQSGCTRT